MRHHVLMVTNNYQPYSGGVVHSLRASRDALLMLGHDVTIVTLDFVGSEPEEGVVRLFCPVRFEYCTNQMALPWRTAKQLSALVDRYAPTIIHAHHPFLLGKAAYVVARSAHVPIVFTHHTLYDRYLHYALLPQRLTKPVVMRRVASYCRDVDATIAPSSFVQRHISEAYGVENDRIWCIPSALNAFNPAAEPKQLGQPIELITVGRFTPEKQIDRLIDALVLLQNRYQGFSWRMRIVGYGYLEAELKRYVYEVCRLTHNQVIFVTSPSRDVLQTLYAQSHIFLFASQSETQGLVLAEALASGLPIIALQGPALDDAIEQGINGMLVNSIEALVDEIVLLCSNAARYKHFSCAAISAASRYGLAEHGEALSQGYNKLVHSS